eukprot:GSMAST32.ASY1.ANO1.147.1 assembled CDS
MIEPCALLPISRFHVLAVGDPKQLPPVLAQRTKFGTKKSNSISNVPSGNNKLLERTMFERLAITGFKPIVLNIQYRCHPKISAISNKLFYNGTLKDGITLQDRHHVLPWPPISFFHVVCFFIFFFFTKKSNFFFIKILAEAKTVKRMVTWILSSGVHAKNIGVICLYKAQVCLYCMCFFFFTKKFKFFFIKILYLTNFQNFFLKYFFKLHVRSSSIGFIDSPSRMNVAITRAKRHLIIVGNKSLLGKSKPWRHVLNAASQCNVCFIYFFNKKIESIFL